MVPPAKGDGVTRCSRSRTGTPRQSPIVSPVVRLFRIVGTQNGLSYSGDELCVRCPREPFVERQEWARPSAARRSENHVAAKSALPVSYASSAREINGASSMTTPSSAINRFRAAAIAARSKRYATRRTQDTSTRTTVENHAPSLLAARRNACSARRNCSSSSFTSNRTTTFVSNAATAARSVRDGLLHVGERHRPDSRWWHEPGGNELLEREGRSGHVLPRLHAKNNDLRVPRREIAGQDNTDLVRLGDSDSDSVLSHGDTRSLARSASGCHVDDCGLGVAGFLQSGRARRAEFPSARAARGSTPCERRARLVQPIQDGASQRSVESQPVARGCLFELLPYQRRESNRTRHRFPDFEELGRSTAPDLDLDTLARNTRGIRIPSHPRFREVDLRDLAQRCLAGFRRTTLLLLSFRRPHELSVLLYWTRKDAVHLARSCGTPGGIRTPDQWIRNPPLYPAELRAQK